MSRIDWKSHDDYQEAVRHLGMVFSTILLGLVVLALLYGLCHLVMGDAPCMMADDWTWATPSYRDTTSEDVWKVFEPIGIIAGALYFWGACMGLRENW